MIPSVQAVPRRGPRAIACATPSIGMAVGGIPDMVRHEQTACSWHRDDTAGLRQAIRELCHDTSPKARTSPFNCHRVAVQEYALEEQGRRYLDLTRACFERAGALVPDQSKYS